MNDAPKLLVEWSSPWEEFVTAVRPALAKSPKRLAGEANTGLFPYRGILASWVCEVLLLIAAIVIPAKLAMIRPYAPPPLPKYDVIYYSGDELPRTEDLGGAQSGNSGRAGGKEAHHRSQTIRVARGNSVREKIVDAPRLNLPRADSEVANLLAYKPIPGPAPTEGLRSSLRAPNLGETAIAPIPQARRDTFQPAPSLVPGIVPPTPPALRGDLSSMRLPGNNPVQIVPPPVSAPEQVTNLNPKLTLPPPSVIAPPPQITREVARSGPGFGPELRNQIVPPPVQVGSATGNRRAVGGIGDASVVPPPVQVGGSVRRQATGIELGGNPNVIAPPVQVTGLARQGMPGLDGSATVIPPPVTVSGGIGGQGQGNRGAGRGGPLDVGEMAVAPSNGGGGSASGSGVIVSSQPGSKAGVPGNGSPGSLAMSPTGGAQPGIGGSGGGTGIGRGTGPGSGFGGEGPGAGKTGAGKGSDTLAKGGISPYPGPGGAGSGTTGKPAVPGVSVRGGSSNIITLPSFGSDGNQPSDPTHSSSLKDRHGSGITIVATARSGGAFNFYGSALKGMVYTTYLDTKLGRAALEFADSTSGSGAYAGDLTAPEPMRTDLPDNLQPSRLIIAFVLDRSGQIKDPKVLEGGTAECTPKVLASLASWKFRPVLRGDQPVEVNAILGFSIDTR
ncbi:MAG TPA: hypothetical protein VFA68_10255 [Terriglobales bacterium]|nr:hypothetical protein [Terriglobales bacterium]